MSFFSQLKDEMHDKNIDKTKLHDLTADLPEQQVQGPDQAAEQDIHIDQVDTVGAVCTARTAQAAGCRSGFSRSSGLYRFKA